MKHYNINSILHTNKIILSEYIVKYKNNKQIILINENICGTYQLQDIKD